MWIVESFLNEECVYGNLHRQIAQKLDVNKPGL